MSKEAFEILPHKTLLSSWEGRRRSTYVSRPLISGEVGLHNFGDVADWPAHRNLGVGVGGPNNGISKASLYYYIMTNKHHTVLYTGKSGYLTDRVRARKEKTDKKSFTS